MNETSVKIGASETGPLVQEEGEEETKVADRERDKKERERSKVHSINYTDFIGESQLNNSLCTSVLFLNCDISSYEDEEEKKKREAARSLVLSSEIKDEKKSSREIQINTSRS